MARLLDVQHRPLGAQPAREPPAGAHDAHRRRARADADQDLLGDRPGALAALGLAVDLHLRVDAVGRRAQRQLAQRDQVRLLEEVGQRPVGLLRDVDLALAQPREQLVRRQVDQLHLVGGFEDGVGHGLPHRDPGDLRDEVVQALEVLDVERRVDVDPGRAAAPRRPGSAARGASPGRSCAPARPRAGAAACARAPRRGRTPRASRPR